MRRFLRGTWFRVFLLWSVLIAALALPMWPKAVTPREPCNYAGAVAPDNGLPTCPPDDANYEAIGVSLLIVLWVAGAVVWLTAFAAAWLWRRQARGKQPAPS